MGKQKNRLTATKPHYHFARIFQAGLDGCNRPRRVEWRWSRRRAASVGGDERELQGSPGPRPRPSPADLPCTDRPLLPRPYPRPADLPCTAPRPTKPGGLPQRASGRWRMPCGGPGPLLAGWRGLTSRPNHFCQLDSKTTYYGFCYPIPPSHQSSNMAPTLGQMSPTLHLRASHPRPGAACPRIRTRPPCAKCPSATYPTPVPTLHLRPSYPILATLLSPDLISATLYHVPPTLHPSPGRGGPAPSRPAEPSNKIPPSTKAPS